MHPGMDAWYRLSGFEPRREHAGHLFDVELFSGGLVRTVEEKFNFIHMPHVLVEVIQDLKTPKPGWIHYCGAQSLADVEADVVRGPFWVRWFERFSEFKAWFFDVFIRQARLEFKYSRKGPWVTVNVVVPNGAIPEGMMHSASIERPMPKPPMCCVRCRRPADELLSRPAGMLCPPCCFEEEAIF